LSSSAFEVLKLATVIIIFFAELFRMIINLNDNGYTDRQVKQEGFDLTYYSNFVIYIYTLLHF